ncbi:MAG: zinc dependent phospholipase C family protein [Lachnospiraceae bacterium]
MVKNMPGYIMHLTEATMIFNQLQRQNQTQDQIKNSEEWKQRFLLGALLPDACSWENKRYTHFWAPSTWEHRIVVPDLAVFQQKYLFQREKFDQAIMMGYFAHLHLDYTFFAEYWTDILEFQKEDGTRAITRTEATQVYLKEVNRKISVSDFFSDKYLYGDYTKLNQYFCEKYQLESPIFCKPQGAVTEEAEYEQLPKLLQDLQEFLRQGECEGGIPQIFHAEQVDAFLQETAKKFIKNRFL